MAITTSNSTSVNARGKRVRTGDIARFFQKGEDGSKRKKWPPRHNRAAHRNSVEPAANDRKKRGSHRELFRRDREVELVRSASLTSTVTSLCTLYFAGMRSFLGGSGLFMISSGLRLSGPPSGRRDGHAVGAWRQALIRGNRKLPVGDHGARRSARGSAALRLEADGTRVQGHTIERDFARNRFPVVRAGVAAATGEQQGRQRQT